MLFILRRSLLSFSLYVAPVILYAQNNLRHDQTFPVIDLRTSVFTWVDVDGGIMAGVNMRLSHRISIAVEPSLLFFDIYRRAGENRQPPHGYKLRTDIRYYFRAGKKILSQQFISPGFHYKNVNRKREETFGINCVNGECDYMQQAMYTENKTETGFFVVWGIRTGSPFTKNERWQTEFYTGIGVKYIIFKQRDLPTGGSFLQSPDERFFFRNNNGRSYLPMLPMGVRLVYVIK